MQIKLRTIKDKKLRSHLQHLRRYLSRRSVSAISADSRSEAVMVLVEIDKLLQKE